MNKINKLNSYLHPKELLIMLISAGAEEGSYIRRIGLFCACSRVSPCSRQELERNKMGFKRLCFIKYNYILYKLIKFNIKVKKRKEKEIKVT